MTMATSTDSLNTTTANRKYKTLRNTDGDTEQEGGSSDSRCVDFWIRLWSFLVVKATLAILVTFIIAYCKDAGFEYDIEPPRITKEGVCSVLVNDSALEMIDDLVVNRNADVLYVSLETSIIVNKTKDTDIYLPKEWIWTQGDSPILAWPESYELWSFGILGLHTKRNVKIQLNLFPKGCSFTWGDAPTTNAIGQALLNFTTHAFSLHKKLQRSKWCYTVRLRNVTRNPVLEQDFSFFVQDLGYKCCRFQWDESSGHFVPRCDDEVTVERLWTNIPFVFAFVTLLISSNIMVFVYQFLSFKSHVYWIHNKAQSHDGYASTADEWLYSDYKSPITFLSFLRNCTHICQGCKTSKAEEPTTQSAGCCTCLKRFFLAVTLLFFSLSVILLSLVMHFCRDTSYHMLKNAINHNIPIGFLSLLFSYEENHDNFMFHIGGPYVFISIYCVLAFFYLLGFECCKPVKSVQDYKTGNFTLNLDLVEKYGRIKCTVNDHYGIFETIHANSRTIFRGGFWGELLERLVFGNDAICLPRCSDNQTELNGELLKRPVFCNDATCSSRCSGKQIVLTFFKLLILPCSILFSISVHLVPFLFASLLILTDCIRRTRCSCLFDLLPILFLSVVHVCLVFSFTIIFFGSAEFLFLVFSFCVLALVIFPGAASGIFVFSLVGVYYVVERFRSIARKYASYRDLTISVSQSLCDKCEGAEAKLSNDKKKLLIAGVNLRAVQYIALVADPQRNILDKTKDGKKQSFFHCHLKDKTLKIIGDRASFTLDSISISGIPLKIEHQEKTDEGQNKLFRIESERSEMKLVLLNADINFDPEEDTCYVTYRNGLPGIPWALMNTIVEEYSPVCAERLQAVIWTVLVSCILAWLSIIIKRFDKWEQMSTIVNALIVVVLVQLSDVVRMFSVDVGEDQKRNILKAQIQMTVQEYWMRQEYQQVTREGRESPCASGTGLTGTGSSETSAV